MVAPAHPHTRADSTKSLDLGIKCYQHGYIRPSSALVTPKFQLLSNFLEELNYNGRVECLCWRCRGEMTMAWKEAKRMKAFTFDRDNHNSQDQHAKFSERRLKK